jgi:hypothetical protein
VSSWFWILLKFNGAYLPVGNFWASKILTHTRWMYDSIRVFSA